MLYRGLNSPLTTSVGRLFDAVSSLLGLRQAAGFEGQAAIEVEFCASTAEEVTTSYPIAISEDVPWVIDWEPMIKGILADLASNVPPSVIAAQFHNTLAESIVAVAKQAKVQDVTLTGGCFQNRFLTERAVTFLEAAGFRPYWHQRIPTNDGGIAVGQVIAAAQQQAPTPHLQKIYRALNH
jgi:hydrogenase maturation protein HypF